MLRFGKASGAGTLSASGNIMTLVDEVGFTEELPESEGLFASMFKGLTNLVDASELKLPAKTLARRCYQTMFNGCTSLQKGPTIGVETGAAYACAGMFQGCSHLAYGVSPFDRKVGVVLPNLVDWTSGSTTTFSDWMSGVSSGGIFKKNANLSAETGTSRIPSGWTV